MATLIIVIEAALVYFALIIDQHSLPMPSLPMNATKVNFIRVLNQPDLINFLINYLLDIDAGIGEWHIFDEVIA